MIIVPAQAWKHQPRGIANPNNVWMDEQMCFAWHAGQVSEVTTGNMPSYNNTTAKGASYGKYWGSGLVRDCTISQVNCEFDGTYMATSDGSGTGDFTMICLLNPLDTGASAEYTFCQKNDAGGTPFGQTTLGTNMAANGSYSAGKCALFTYGGASSGKDLTGATQAGAWTMYAGVREGTNHNLFVNGLQYGAAGTTVRDILAPGPRTVGLGHRGGGGTTEGYPQDIAFAAMFNKALSNEQIAELSRNPWQVFKAHTARIYSFPEAAGGLSIPVAAYHYNHNIGSNN